MNLLLKKGQDEFKSKADWYNLHVLNGFIYDEDLGRKEQISKSPLLSTLFILNVYGVYSKKGAKGWLCGPLEDVEIFNQKRGKKGHELNVFGIVLGNYKENGCHTISDDGKSQIRLYVSKPKVPSLYKSDLYKYTIDKDVIQNFKRTLSSLEATLAHELEHAWNNNNGERFSGEYIGFSSFRQEIKAVFPFMHGITSYSIDPDELEARYSNAYTKWRKSYKNGNRESLLTIYCKGTWADSFDEICKRVNTFMNKIVTDPNNSQYCGSLNVLYQFFVFLGSKDAVKHNLKVDRKRKKYEEMRETYADEIEVARKVIPNLQKACQYLVQFKDKLSQDMIKPWLDYLDEKLNEHGSVKALIDNYVTTDAFLKDVKKFIKKEEQEA